MGKKTSKTANLDAISIQFFYIHIWWLISRGECPPHPPKWNPAHSYSPVCMRHSRMVTVSVTQVVYCPWHWFSPSPAKVQRFEILPGLVTVSVVEMCMGDCLLPRPSCWCWLAEEWSRELWTGPERQQPLNSFLSCQRWIKKVLWHYGETTKHNNCQIFGIYSIIPLIIVLKLLSAYKLTNKEQMAQIYCH